MHIHPIQRTCARCGQSKPAAEFDKRFVATNCKVTCAACRGIADETRKWQVVWEQRKEWDRRWEEGTTLREEERQKREDERRRHDDLIQEQKRIYEEKRLIKQTLGRVWRERLRILGFDEQDQTRIEYIHEEIDRSNIGWNTIKRIFLSLVPPYQQSTRVRPNLTSSVKHEIFHAQHGRCFYCNKPIIVSGEQAIVSCLCLNCHDDRGSVGYTTGKLANWHCLKGQIDHIIPWSRGGRNEHSNLCYACVGCNQRKQMRTAEEFARYPDDPVSQIGFHLGFISQAINFELRGYNSFNSKLPWH